MPSDEQKKIATIIFLDGHEFKVELDIDFPSVLHGNDGENDVCFILDEDNGKQTGIYRQAKEIEVSIPVEHGR